MVCTVFSQKVVVLRTLLHLPRSGLSHRLSWFSQLFTKFDSWTWVFNQRLLLTVPQVV